MSASTIRDNSDSSPRERDFPFAEATVISTARQMDASPTRIENSAHSTRLSGRTSALTIISTAHSPDTNQQEPSLFERYTIIEKLFDGAEALLYLARRNDTRATVVLKVYHKGISPDPLVLERIRHGAAEHLVRLFEHGWLSEGGQSFEEMEHLDGSDLTSILLGYPLDDYSSRLIVRELADALHHLHTPDENGSSLIHRDIKPANILIRSNGISFDLVLCDFGISIIVPDGETVSVAQKDCTPRYAAPETFNGCLSIAADYWSLGVLLYETITGVHPFDGLSDDDIKVQLIGGVRPDVSRIDSLLWRELIGGLTEPEPAKRWGHGATCNWLDVNSSASSMELAVDEESIETFTFLQTDTLYALVYSLVTNWARVSPLLDDALFHRFLDKTLNRLIPGAAMGDYLESDGNRDIRLLKLIYRLDPKFPRFWKGRPIHHEELMKKCWSVIDQADAILSEYIRELFELQVLQVIGEETNDEECRSRGFRWQQSVSGYERLKSDMIRCGVPDEYFPIPEYRLSMLYLLACEEGTVDLPLYDITNKLLFTQPCLSGLQPQKNGFTPEQRLLRFCLIPQYLTENRDLLKISHQDILSATTIVSQQAHAWGWREPTVSLTATYIDYEMKVCGSNHKVAKGVILSWDVQGAFLVYLSRFGLVRSNDRRPSERMQRWHTYRVVDNCPCESHNNQWFPLWETTTFTLTAIGLQGISIYRLPPIEVPQPLLETQPQLLESSHFTEAIPELLAPATLSTTIPQLLPSPVLIGGAICSADILPSPQFVGALSGRDDLLPIPEFIKFEADTTE